MINRMEEEQPRLKNRTLIGEFGTFIWQRKAWWLVPIIILFVMVGALIIFGQSSALSPFIYVLF